MSREEFYEEVIQCILDKRAKRKKEIDEMPKGQTKK